MSADERLRRLDNIPRQLRARPCWVLVRHEYRKDPETGDVVLHETQISFHTGRRCNPVPDPRELATFAQVRSAWERWPDAFDAVAIALGPCPAPLTRAGNFLRRFR